MHNPHQSTYAPIVPSRAPLASTIPRVWLPPLMRDKYGNTIEFVSPADNTVTTNQDDQIRTTANQEGTRR